MATTSQLVQMLNNVDPNKIDPVVLEAIDKMIEKATDSINHAINAGVQYGTGRTVVVQYNDLAMKFQELINKTGTKMSGQIPNSTSAPTAGSIIDMVAIENEVVQVADTTPKIKLLTFYKYLNNALGFRMTSIDHEIQEEIRAAKQQS